MWLVVPPVCPSVHLLYCILTSVAAPAAAPAKEAPKAATPAATPAATHTPAATAAASTAEEAALAASIEAQGGVVRDLKANKGDKNTIAIEVDKLKTLKNEFKAKFGKEYGGA